MRTLLILLVFTALAIGNPPIKTYQLPAAKYTKAIEYHRQLNGLHFLQVAWDVAVLFLMIRRRIGARVRNSIRVRVFAIAALLALPWAAGLPFDVYRHWLSLHYGLSVEPWLPWLMDLAKSGLVAGVAAVLLLLGAFALVRRWPRRWWIAVWMLAVLLMIAGAYAAPLVFDPLFFKFHPLGQSRPELVRALQNVATRAGYPISDDRILEMEASDKTRAVNAYMTGFGGSRRIVIWDNTIAALTTPQIQTVFAHEVGHYALHHIPWNIAAGSLGLLAVFWSANWIALRKRVALDDIANLPLLLAVVVVVGFVLEPVANGYSRWLEHQADIYEIDTMCGLVQDPGVNSAEVDQIMAEIDLDEPDPGAFTRFWLYDHPPTKQRMLFAQEYAAANKSRCQGVR